MTRADRSRSKLFPTGEDTVFPGTHKNLIYEQGHTIGTKILAGKFVVPTEAEDRFRIEMGPAAFRGVDQIGATTGSGSPSNRVTVTTHANTEPGDTLVLVIIHGTTTTGNDMTPGLGWQRMDNLGQVIDVGVEQGVMDVFFRIATEADEVHGVYTANDVDADQFIIWTCITFRGARIMHDNDLEFFTVSGTNSTTLAYQDIAKSPRGSVAVQVYAAGDTSNLSPTASFTGNFQEVIDASEDTVFAGATGTLHLAVATKSIKEEGYTSFKTVTSSQTMDFLHGCGFIVEPKSIGIVGWEGTPGTETFEINEHGRARITDIQGDMRIHGTLAHQVPMGTMTKGSDQNIASSVGTTSEVAFGRVTANDRQIINLPNNSFDFDGERDRGIWRIMFNCVWSQTSATGRRLAEIHLDGTEVARSNVDAAPSGVTSQIVEYWFPVTQDAVITFEASQDSGGNLDVVGNNTMLETYAQFIYLRDLD
jgi:hypothetical protein